MPSGCTQNIVSGQGNQGVFQRDCDGDILMEVAEFWSSCSLVFPCTILSCFREEAYSYCYSSSYLIMHSFLSENSFLRILRPRSAEISE